MYKDKNYKIEKFDIGECSETPYTPDFGTLGELQAKYGNDIDLMVNKPQYRDLLGASLRPIDNATEYPELTDEQLIESLPSREFDVNELTEYAHQMGSQYAKDNSKEKSE